MSAREIGLFPLAAVLVPGELMPLHIFEERYKDLVADCRERGAEFALLYADSEGARELGTTAEVVEVVETFEDGRMNIVIRGGQVVRVVELTRGRSYMTGNVEAAEDDLAAGEEAVSALDLYRKIAAATGQEPDPAVGGNEGGPLSYAIAARVDFPAAEKQRILERRAEKDRLMMIVELLSRGLENLATAALIQARAKTNGKVAPPEETPEPEADA
ncbi:MAG TPA: LON peptidase substrate-binding domain-containing protein [Gaiellales bacterium]|jgi:Lon protease-like protein|nr:LON peptidase substrate-binding domain-containing protein [Gaiellales bacterium]